ncbi:hypothetical protein J7M22_00025 [Candidatus Poribacteria bacterium]|nr:hypothetical protein [Candidatus Poribacteria bacterium]
MREIESDVSYRAHLFNPVNGDEMVVGEVRPNKQGNWKPLLSRPPLYQDWILILEIA